MRTASLWPGFPFCHLAGIDGTSNRLRWSVLRRPRRRVCDRRFSFPFESFQPDSTKSRVENLPSTFNYGWDTLCARAHDGPPPVSSSVTQSMFNERLNFSPDRRITCVMQLNRNSHLCLGALRSWAAFAGLLVLAQFSFRIER